MMLWLFERTVEVAAWIALFISWVSLLLGVYWCYAWIATLSTTEPDHQLIRDAAKAGGAFVGFSLALGALACVDRFLFDAEEA